MPPSRRRDSFFATSTGRDWTAIERELVDYWVKVAEVLPNYYAGRATQDPLATEMGTVPPDAGWNRLVFILDPVYGKITTNLWTGSQQPQQLDRVWIIIKFSMLNEQSREKEPPGLNDFSERMLSALGSAAGHPDGTQAIAHLQDWRDMSFWVMDAESPETLRPIPLAK